MTTCLGLTGYAEGEGEGEGEGEDWARARVRASWSVGQPRALESALPLAPSMVEKMGACVISRLSGSR